MQGRTALSAFSLVIDMFYSSLKEEDIILMGQTQSGNLLKINWLSRQPQSVFVVLLCGFRNCIVDKLSPNLALVLHHSQSKIEASMS